MIQNRAVIWGTRSAPGVVAHARTSLAVIPATAQTIRRSYGQVRHCGSRRRPMFPLCLGFTWTVVPCSATDRPAFCQGRNAKRGRMILDPPAAGPSVVDRLEVVDPPAALGGPVARASHLATSRWAARWGWVPIVAVTTAVVRVPLLGLPLDPDEGGYAYVAHRWAAGAQLYTTAAWVDRPPALMLVFRWITDLSYSPIALRLAAVLAAMVVALGAGAC